MFARRALAFAVDWLIALAWGALLFGAVMLATGGNPGRPESPWMAQAIGFLCMTGPFTLYFAIAEGSVWQASVGKRALGLVVASEDGSRLSFSSSLIRNALKFVPWELGHTLAQQAAFSNDAGIPSWVWVPAIGSVAGPVWWLVSLVATGRTPYDRWARARVAPIGVPNGNPHNRAQTGRPR